MKMARNWRDDYERLMVPGEDNEHLFKDFLEEINTHLVPYVTRMQETECISRNDASALIFYFVEQIEYLKELDGKNHNGGSDRS